VLVLRKGRRIFKKENVHSDGTSVGTEKRKKNIFKKEEEERSRMPMIITLSNSQY
jgi:hypothetical protein